MILSGLLTYDSDLIRRVANDAMDRIKDDVYIAYQVHRALLWTGDIDGASLILPAINISDLGNDVRLLANLRQVCAENRVDDAKAMVAQIDKDHSDDLFMVWISRIIMSEDEEATELLRPLDDARDFHTLKDYLGYPYFDPRPHPNLLAYMDAQKIDPERAPGKMPYRCNR
jgi:hypothetical protein